MKNKVTFISLIISFSAMSFIGCKKQKTQKIQMENEKKIEAPIAQKDSVIEEAIPEPEPEPEPEILPVEPNKYFLIAGSFTDINNAEKLKNDLISEGFDSEIITRTYGLNNEYYKVSFKGFSDKTEAFNQLKYEREQPNHENVWLLIKH